MMQFAGSKPFEGLKVLDVSQGLAGPYCAELLGRQGADVIKVEPPEGDWVRDIGARYGDHTAISFVASIGKRAITIDARQDAGKAALRRLAENADVLVHNFRLGVTDRLGIGADSLMAHNPDLIYVSVFGFGDAGPWVRRPATDTIAQGFSGLMHLAGDASGPRRIPFPIIDLVTGLYAGQQTAAALYRQARGHGGSHVTASLLETGAAMQGPPLLEAALRQATGAAPPPAGALGAPMGAFKAADGYLNLSCVGDAMFQGIGRALGVDAWASGEAFATQEERVEGFDKIMAETARRIAGGKRADWLEAFAAEGVLSGPVNTYEDLIADPQASAIGLFDTLAFAGGLTAPIVRPPGAPPPGDPVAAPTMGQHSIEILRQAGYGQAEIDALLASKAVVAAEAPA